MAIAMIKRRERVDLGLRLKRPKRSSRRVVGEDSNPIIVVFPWLALTANCLSNHRIAVASSTKMVEGWECWSAFVFCFQLLNSDFDNLPSPGF